MAKVIITIEDTDASRQLVKLEVHPSFKELATIMMKGRGLTAAHRVAMFAVQQMKHAAASDDMIKKNLKGLILPKGM